MRQAPASLAEYEQRVESTPDDGYVWVQYMAYLVTLGEANRARAIADRALQAINYRCITHLIMTWTPEKVERTGEVLGLCSPAITGHMLIHLESHEKFGTHIICLTETETPEKVENLGEVVVRLIELYLPAGLSSVSQA